MKHSLWNKYCVCEAFEIAKEDIRRLININEASKYRIMISDTININGKVKKWEHKWFPITNFKEGKLTKTELVPDFDWIPANVEWFQGRQQEMYEVITLLNSKRLVNILGPPGIGKTSFARNLWNHIKDRRKFYDGILYVGLRGWESAHMFLVRMSVVIQDSSKIDNNQLNELNKIHSREYSADEDINSEEEYEKLKRFIVKIIRNKEVLIWLDNCEDTLEDDWEKFVRLIDYFLDEWSNLKFLLTSRKYINKLEHNQEVPYHLYSLSPTASAKLLLGRLTRNIDDKEFEDLNNYKIPKSHHINQQFQIVNQGKIQFVNHPFILMLGGHPQAIWLAASILEHQSLVKLFEQMLESSLLDALGNQGKQSYASLRLSLDISIQYLKRNDLESLNFFKFIGLLPGGVEEEELTQIWGDKSWENFAEILRKASLLVYKPTEKQYTLLPFMGSLAWELLDEDSGSKKLKFHLKLCKFYFEFCKDWLENIDKKNFTMDRFIKKEANIWAWIYRSVNRKKDNIDYDEENENSRMLLANSFKETNGLRMRSNTYQQKNLNAISESKVKKINDKPSLLSPINAEKREAEIEDFFNSNMVIKSNSTKNDGLEGYPSTQSQDVCVSGLKIDEGDIKTSYATPSKLATKFQHTMGVTNFSKAVSSDESSAKRSQCKVEEMMVIYYATTAIRLSMISDSAKALSVYKKKYGISKVSQGNILKLIGVTKMLSEDKNFNKAKVYFTKALEIFSKINCSKGWAACKLAILRCDWEIIFNKSANIGELLSLINEANKTKELFSKFKYKRGIERLMIYIDWLTNKLNGVNSGNFRKTLKNKTLKFNQGEHTKESLFNLEASQDEDIKLLIEVAEENTELDSIFWETVNSF